MVWGLTFRCVIKRVVKNDCNKAGRLAGSRMQGLPSFLQPLGGCSQQFGSAGQIPIGVGNVGMPEIGGQDGQAPLGILTIAIPAQQRLDRKSVSKIVQARAATGIHSTQSNLSGQDVERPVDLAFIQSVAVQVYQEMSLGANAKALVAAFRVVGQDLTSRGMQWNQAGLSELGPSNRENAFGPIHIPRSEAERLTQPQACDRQQPEQTVVGPGPQRVDGRPAFSSLQQCTDLVSGIKVWLSAFRPVRQHTEWRNLCRGIRRTPVPGEAAYHAEPRRPLTWPVIGILRGPFQCQVYGDSCAAFPCQARQELS